MLKDTTVVGCALPGGSTNRKSLSTSLLKCHDSQRCLQVTM